MDDISGDIGDEEPVEEDKSIIDRLKEFLGRLKKKLKRKDKTGSIDRSGGNTSLSDTSEDLEADIPDPDNVSAGEEKDEIEVVDSAAEIYEDINEVREEMNRKLQEEVSLLHEEIEELGEDLEDEIEKEKEDLEEKVEKLQENTQAEIDTLQGDIQSINSEIKDLGEVVNTKTDEGQHQEVRELLQEVEEDVNELNDKIEEKAEQSYVEDMREVQNLLAGELDYKADKYDLSDSTEGIEGELKKLQNRVKKLGTGDNIDTIQPSEATDDMVGKYIQMQGRIEFNKEVSDHYLYTIRGPEEDMIIRTGEELEEGKGKIDGIIKEMEGVLFLDSVQP